MRLFTATQDVLGSQFCYSNRKESLIRSIGSDKQVGTGIREVYRHLMTVEESMRHFYPKPTKANALQFREALDRLHRIIKEDGPFQGVIGYSEGAYVAASLLLDFERQSKSTGSKNPLTHAIFFSGWPPNDPDTAECLLSDEIGQVLSGHTMHVLGSNDPFIHGSLALYDICKEDNALIFDHGKGHLVPREPRVLKEVAAFIREHMSEH